MMLLDFLRWLVTISGVNPRRLSIREMLLKELLVDIIETHIKSRLN